MKHGGQERSDNLKLGWMIYRFFIRLSLLPLNIIWFWAYNGFSRYPNDVKIVKRLSRIRARNGPKQIILVQIANSLWRLDKREEAVTQYKYARDSEIKWDQRKNKKVSKYIILYCEYCINLILIEPSSNSDPDLLNQFQMLKSLQVPDSIKSYKLPLPPSPTGKIY